MVRLELVVGDLKLIDLRRACPLLGRSLCRPLAEKDGRLKKKGRKRKKEKKKKYKSNYNFDFYIKKIIRLKRGRVCELGFEVQPI